MIGGGGGGEAEEGERLPERGRRRWRWWCVQVIEICSGVQVEVVGRWAVEIEEGVGIGIGIVVEVVVVRIGHDENLGLESGERVKVVDGENINTRKLAN